MNALLLLLVAAPARGDVVLDEIAVRFKGKEVGLEELAELGPSPQTAARTWAPFAEERGYRMTLTDDGRVLLLTPGKRAPSNELRWIDKTCALVDELLPAPAPPDDPAPEPAPEPGPAPDGGEGVPEWHREYQWGAGEWRRDVETAVLVQATGTPDYAAALEMLAERFDYLKGWIDSARSDAGCTLQQPLAAIWLLGHEDLEEWDPENELVHRLAELLVLRRFDRQPAWLLQGLAWHVEYELKKTHYCFPWRASFVYETEHTSWEPMLKDAHRKDGALAIDAVVALSRGNFQLEHARNAWGAARFLALHHADALPRLLEDLRELQREKGVVTHDDGSWERIPGFEPSAADQLALLKKAAGDDVLTELLAFYQRGRGYRPPR